MGSNKPMLNHTFSVDAKNHRLNLVAYPGVEEVHEYPGIIYGELIAKPAAMVGFYF